MLQSISDKIGTPGPILDIFWLDDSHNLQLTSPHEAKILYGLVTSVRYLFQKA
jgi:hypothetical protein